jgi:electron transfer flavoprotein alpha/beta subunit
MNVVALIRPVHDAALAGGVTGSTLRVDDPSLSAFSLACTLTALGEPGVLTALAVGPPEWDGALRDVLAMGAHAVLRAWSPAPADPEIAATAHAICDALPPAVDVIVSGAAATDHGSGALPAAVAALLDWPLLADVTAVESDPSGLVAQVRASGGRRQVYRLQPPLVVIVAPQPAQPPYPPLARRLAAKRATVPVCQLQLSSWDPGLEPAGTGPAWPRRRHLIQPEASGRAGDRLRSLMSAGISSRKSDTIDAAGAAGTLATWLIDGGFLATPNTPEVTTS